MAVVADLATSTSSSVFGISLFSKCSSYVDSIKDNGSILFKANVNGRCCKVSVGGLAKNLELVNREFGSTQVQEQGRQVAKYSWSLVFKSPDNLRQATGGGGVTPPGAGGSQTPRGAGGSQTPPGAGGSQTPPGAGGSQTPPGAGGSQTPPGAGGSQTPPGAGGSQTPPGAGGSQTPPGAGGSQTPPGAGGSQTPPGAGGSQTPRGAGGSQTPPGAGGSQTPPGAGGSQTPPGAGGSQTPPGAGGSQTPPGAGGSQTPPGAGGSQTPPGEAELNIDAEPNVRLYRDGNYVKMILNHPTCRVYEGAKPENHNAAEIVSKQLEKGGTEVVLGRADRDGVLVKSRIVSRFATEEQYRMIRQGEFMPLADYRNLSKGESDRAQYEIKVIDSYAGASEKNYLLDVVSGGGCVEQRMVRNPKNRMIWPMNANDRTIYVYDNEGRRHVNFNMSSRRGAGENGPVFGTLSDRAARFGSQVKVKNSSEQIIFDRRFADLN